MFFLSFNLRLSLIPIIPRHPFIIRSISNPHAFIAFLFIPLRISNETSTALPASKPKRRLDNICVRPSTIKNAIPSFFPVLSPGDPGGFQFILSSQQESSLSIPTKEYSKKFDYST